MYDERLSIPPRNLIDAVRLGIEKELKAATDKRIQEELKNYETFLRNTRNEAIVAVMDSIRITTRSDILDPHGLHIRVEFVERGK